MVGGEHYLSVFIGARQFLGYPAIGDVVDLQICGILSEFEYIRHSDGYFTVSEGLIVAESNAEGYIVTDDLSHFRNHLALIELGECEIRIAFIQLLKGGIIKGDDASAKGHRHGQHMKVRKEKGIRIYCTLQSLG